MEKTSKTHWCSWMNNIAFFSVLEFTFMESNDNLRCYANIFNIKLHWYLRKKGNANSTISGSVILGVWFLTMRRTQSSSQTAAVQTLLTATIE